MSGLTKISLLVSGILVVSAIVLMVLVKTLVTPEKVREPVPLAEKSLQRKIILGKIEIGLFSGVFLQDLHVLQKAGTDDLITFKSMDLHYQLLPLLTGKIVVDQVKFVQPKIVVIRNIDGSFNFSDLLDRKVETAEKDPQAASAEGKSTSSGRAFNLLINEVVISGGEVILIDGSKGGKAPSRYAVKQLSFQARQIAPGKSFPIELSASLNGTGVALTAQLTGQVTLAGQANDGAQLVQNASVHLNNILADVAGRKVGISGDIEYDGRQLKAEKLQLNLGDQQAQLTVKAANLSSDLITGDFHLSADTLDINKLVPAATIEEGKPGDEAGPPGAGGDMVKPPVAPPQHIVAEEVGPFALPVEMQGTIAVNKVIYRQLPMEQVHVDLLIKNNHLLITRLHSGVAGGELTAVADIDLGVKGLSYQGQLDLIQAQPASLVSGLFPDTPKNITGTMQSQNTFSGHGTIPDNLLKALLVKGQTQVQKGQVTGSSLLKQLAGFLGNPDLEVLSFEVLQNQYELRDRVVHLTGSLDSSKIRLQSVGTVSLDGPLDLNLNAHPAPGIFASSGGGGLLQQVVTNKDGWGVLPLKVDGTISNPRCSLDNKALQKQAVGKAWQEVQRQLQNKIAPEGGDGAPPKQLLDKTLDKLFGN